MNIEPWTNYKPQTTNQSLPVSIIKKQAIGHAIITYAGLLLGVVNILWLLPGGLSAEQIGLRSIIISSSFLVAPVARMGFTKVAVKGVTYFLKYSLSTPVVAIFIDLVWRNSSGIQEDLLDLR